MQLKILTPEKEIYNGSAVSIRINTTEGSVGIMSNHSNFTALLETGPLLVRDEQEKLVPYFISNGLLEVSNNVATVLVTRCSNLDKFNFDEWQKEIYEISKKVSDNPESEFYQRLLKETISKKEVAERYRLEV